MPLFGEEWRSPSGTVITFDHVSGEINLAAALSEPLPLPAEGPLEQLQRPSEEQLWVLGKLYCDVCASIRLRDVPRKEISDESENL